MRTLVTGCNGFIGRNLCRWLKHNTDLDVIGLGRNSSNNPYIDNFVKLDLTDNNAYDVLCHQLLNTDCVIHLAADMRREPFNQEVVYENCVGTQKLLEACETAEVSTFLQLSSLPVIGKPTILPITEKHPLKPPTVYHATKIMEELLADYACYAHGIRAASLRISAPVGIGMKESTIFPTFVRNAVNNQDIIILGKGTREQTYIHVDDISRALYLSINEENVSGVYNLSSNNIISNIDLAKLILELTKSSSKIVMSESCDPCDGELWDVDCSKLMADSSFEARVGLQKMVEDLVAFYRG